jgi:hypothetical protein
MGTYDAAQELNQALKHGGDRRYSRLSGRHGNDADHDQSRDVRAKRT